MRYLERIAMAVLLLGGAGLAFGTAPGVGDRMRDVPGCWRLCTREEARAGKTIGWGPARLDAGRARLFLEQVLRRLGEDPGEYRLKVAREDWERGSRRLSLMRRDRRGFELFLRATAVEDGECGVCIEGEFWLRDMTGEWPHVKPKRKVLMRATHQACVKDFLRAAEDYRNADKEWVEEDVRERWAKFFEELASGFDPFAYRWRITIWRDECYVELEPILAGLPSRSYMLEIPGEEALEMKLYFDEGWSAGRLFRRDAGTGQCRVENVASGKARVEPTTDAWKGNAPSD